MKYEDDYTFYWELLPEHRKEMKEKSDQELEQLRQWHVNERDLFFGDSKPRRQTIALIEKIQYGREVIEAI